MTVEPLIASSRRPRANLFTHGSTTSSHPVVHAVSIKYSRLTLCAVTADDVGLGAESGRIVYYAAWIICLPSAKLGCPGQCTTLPIAKRHRCCGPYTLMRSTPIHVWLLLDERPKQRLNGSRVAEGQDRTPTGGRRGQENGQFMISQAAAAQPQQHTASRHTPKATHSSPVRFSSPSRGSTPCILHCSLLHALS